MALAEIIEDDRRVTRSGQQGCHIAADVPGAAADENPHRFTTYHLQFEIRSRTARDTRDGMINRKS
jgi:uncharacterized OsmC-like protein